MLKRLVRRSLRRCGIRVSFPGLICAEYIKSVCIGSEGHAKITVQKKLVFLEVPEAGDLHDTCTVDPETTLDTFVRRSPDSEDGARRRTGSGALEIDWMPISAVTRYALHEHEYEWSPIGSQLQPALCTEYICDAKTGHFLCELITPQAFEAAIVFERPRWPLLNTERRIMRYALKQIDAGGGRPAISENGQRIEWRIAEPKPGTRYLCVAFHQNGLQFWNDDLQKNSLVGRMRRLAGKLAPSLAQTGEQPHT
jgi:hypothetical protein